MISTWVGNILCDSAGLSSCPKGLCACPGSTRVSGMPKNKSKSQACALGFLVPQGSKKQKMTEVSVYMRDVFLLVMFRTRRIQKSLER